ncbi:class I SAM-dependent methyltransferase [Dongia sp.]|uniref:class I SAM-dependent methyltransferase n=1 Tax=Dongia sp. TaxID=1977262 RepID=UPI0035B2C00A
MFARLLRASIHIGHIALIDHRGRRQDFGGGAPSVTLRLNDPALKWKLGLNPWLKVGEAYMDGTLTIEDGSLYDFIDIAMKNTQGLLGVKSQRILSLVNRMLRWWHQHNPVGAAQQHVAHHYDLSRKLFELFLDDSMQYSCAYFTSATATLAEAQQAKMRHIASKLLLKPGQRVLDIGCGWGGLGIYLAKTAGVKVTGVTLSREQHEIACARVKAAGLEGEVDFKLQDYRLEPGRFERIVSVGMFEHVGLKHFPEFFAKVEELLVPGGVALLHAIGRRDGPGHTNPWLRKYIFPGGYSPALSEVLPVVERTGLWVTDIEILRLHYAETLKGWRENFDRNRAAIRALYDERFCRMWEFYLIGSELSFRYDYNMVFQMQLGRGIDAVPITRDYMFDWERADAARPRAQIVWDNGRAAE